MDGLHHLPTSRCKCLLILAIKLPILGIILYRKGINPRSLIGTIGSTYNEMRRGGVEDDAAEERLALMRGSILLSRGQPHVLEI